MAGRRGCLAGEWRDATSLDDELLDLTAEQLQALRCELGAVIGSYRGGPLRQDASEWPGRRSTYGHRNYDARRLLVCLAGPMASSVACGRLADMAGITGLTGWVGIVLNAPDARALAYFYRDLFGLALADDEPEWCTIRIPGAPANLAFQTEDAYERPTWPATSGKQQMMLHLDIGVRDLATAVDDAVALGAGLPGHQPQDDVRVLLDPAGHPFCLYVDRD